MQLNETPAGLVGLFSEVDLYQQIRWQSYEQDDRREPTDEVSKAVCASSRLRDQRHMIPPSIDEETHLLLEPDPGIETHYLMLDLDVETYLVPSTTPGHYHLYVRQQIPWRDLEQLLKALAACGIIEPGYAHASVERRSTTLRLPWIKKEFMPEEGDPMQVHYQFVMPQGASKTTRQQVAKIPTTEQYWQAVQFIDAHEDLSIVSEPAADGATTPYQRLIAIQHATYGNVMSGLFSRDDGEVEALTTLLGRFNIVDYLDWVKRQKIADLTVADGNDV